MGPACTRANENHVRTATISTMRVPRRVRLAFVAAVAVLDPEITEKAADAMIVVIASPPRKWPNHL